jgi:hypothetical protein
VTRIFTAGLVSGIAAVVAAAAVALGGATPAASSGQGGCYPAGVRQLARDAVARVYEAGTPAGGPRLGGTAVYACYLRRGHPVALAPAGGFTRVGPVALAGPVVAYASAAMGVDTSSSTVSVLNLASGARRTLTAASPPRRPESFTAVSSLVVTARGSVAWIASRSGVGQPQTTYEVRRSDASGSALLDSGTSIASSSLRRAGAKITWIDGGRTRSAPLR